MSAELMGKVWHLNLSHGQQVVMLALADHAHDDGTHCYPGVPYLAWKTDYSERNITRILGELEAAEIIEAQTSKKGGAGHVTEYQIHVEKGDKKDKYNPDNSRKRVTTQTEKGDNSDNNPDNSAQKGDKSSIGLYIHPRAVQPSENHKEPSVKAETEQIPDDTTTQCLQLLLQVNGFPRDQGKNAIKVAEYRAEYPGADAVEVCKDFRAYSEETGKPPTLLRLRNFFKQAAKSAPTSNGHYGKAKTGSVEEGYEWLFRK